MAFIGFTVTKANCKNTILHNDKRKQAKVSVGLSRCLRFAVSRLPETSGMPKFPHSTTLEGETDPSAYTNQQHNTIITTSFLKVVFVF